MANTIQDAMALAGLAPHKVLDIPDNGKLTRYRVNGDKAGSTTSGSLKLWNKPPFEELSSRNLGN
ncbi:MAG: hypothetical protein Q8O85_16565 [Rhodoferax sp.]|uniref:hypothetical protein n=1 Tax=Rhodoferax sp. TaxID=50421 RepID=UPI0027356B96|nr:hypothetical protein [Rhodoferax sp.]MDP2680315.1 hypothetical protein [Rhodoferax sp.]